MLYLITTWNILSSWRYSCRCLFSFDWHEDLVHEGKDSYEQVQLLNTNFSEEHFDDNSSKNSANKSNINAEDYINYDIQNSTSDIDKGADLFEEKMLSNLDESSEEKDNNVVEAEDKVYSHIQLYGKVFMKEQHPEQEQISSLFWESNIELEQPNLVNTKRSKLNSEF